MMLADPCHGFISRLHGRSRGERWTTHHMDLEAELTCRFDFGVGGTASRVFRKHIADVVIREQSRIVACAKWSARCQQLAMPKIRRKLDRIHNADQIAMLRSEAEGVDRLPTQSGEDALSLGGERRNRCFDSIVLDPVVTRDRRPGRTFDSKQWYAACATGVDGVRADARCKRVRRVDEKVDLLVPQIVGQPRYSPESADARRKRTRRRVGGASCQRQSRTNVWSACQEFGEGARFRGAAEKQNAQRTFFRCRFHGTAMP